MVLHAPRQGIHRAALERLADLRLFYSGVIDAEENDRIADAVARLEVCGTESEFRHVCDTAMRELTNLVGEGSGVVHGVAATGTTEGSSDQAAIDALFD